MLRSDKLPFISSVSPSSGTVGTTVVISGKHLTSPTSQTVVKFRGVSASFLSPPTASKLQVLVPTSAKTGEISVSVGDTTVFSPNPFVVPTSSEEQAGVSETEGTIQDMAADVQQWGDSVAKQMHTKCEWTDIDASKHRMKKYPDDKVIFTFANLDVQQPEKDPGSYSYAVTRVVNESSSVQTETVTLRKTATTSFRWSVTEGLKISDSSQLGGALTLGFKGVDAVDSSAMVDGHGTLGWEFNLSSTQSKEERISVDWSHTTVIAAKPQLVTVAKWGLQKNKMTWNWTADVVMANVIAIRFHEKHDLAKLSGYENATAPHGPGHHQLWFVPVADVFTAFNAANPDSPYTVNEDGTVSFQARGTLTGLGDLPNANVIFEEHPLPEYAIH